MHATSCRWRRPMIVFSNKRAVRLTPICFCASDTIVSYESASGLKHGLAIRRTRSHYSLFRVSLPVLNERQTLCG